MINEVRMENTLISGLCYELYKNDWMRRISTERKANLLKNWYQETEQENRSVFGPEQFLDEEGFDGELYVCFEEFLEAEYQDKEYMKELLSNDELFAEYEADLSFVCEQDCSKISDSLMLSSETTVAKLTYKGHEATIEVRGDVKVAFNQNEDESEAPDIYRDISEMPQELKNLISTGEVYADRRVLVDDNNWFELFYKEHAECVDCEYMSPDALKELIFEYVMAYEKHPDQYDEYKAQNMKAV